MLSQGVTGGMERLQIQGDSGLGFVWCGPGGGTGKAPVRLSQPRCLSQWLWSWPGTYPSRGATQQTCPCPRTTILSCARAPSEGRGHPRKGLTFPGHRFPQCEVLGLPGHAGGDGPSPVWQVC